MIIVVVVDVLLDQPQVYHVFLYLARSSPPPPFFLFSEAGVCVGYTFTNLSKHGRTDFRRKQTQNIMCIKKHCPLNFPPDDHTLLLSVCLVAVVWRPAIHNFEERKVITTNCLMPHTMHMAAFLWFLIIALFRGWPAARVGRSKRGAVAHFSLQRARPAYKQKLLL